MEVASSSKSSAAQSTSTYYEYPRKGTASSWNYYENFKSINILLDINIDSSYLRDKINLLLKLKKTFLFFQL
jgi:hypothetical protein